MASLSLEKVKKIYENGIAALHTLDLQVADKEFMVILGPSGCGKTSLLRLIAGLDQPSGGVLKMDGRVVTNLAARDRQVAMVFQDYALYPHMTVRENMAFGLKVRKTGKGVINERVSAAAATLGLTGLLDRKPRDLSGGEQQRVALGRAIVHEPSLFLFDEPLSNLDAALRQKMRKELKLLHQKLETTMVYVTHDQLEAMSLGDRICIMNEGQVMQVGPPEEIYRSPENLFTAEFIGSAPINVIAGELNLAENRFESAPIGFKLPESWQQKLQGFKGKAVRLGIRPEDLVLRPDSVPGSMKASIVFIEELGDAKLIYLNCGEQELRVKCSVATVPRPAEEHYCEVMLEKCHLFDVKDGKNLLL